MGRMPKALEPDIKRLMDSIKQTGIVNPTGRGKIDKITVVIDTLATLCCSESLAVKDRIAAGTALAKLLEAIRPPRKYEKVSDTPATKEEEVVITKTEKSWEELIYGS